MNPTTQWVLKTRLKELQEVEMERLFTRLQNEKRADAVALEYKMFEGYKKAMKELENISEELL